MKVSDFLSPADVITDVAFADKQKLLEDLARRAATIVDVQPALILSELVKREQLGSTGMGGGVAIPHARFHQVAKPFGMLVRLKRPIAFDAVDDRPVDTIVLLLLPDAPNGERLGALACIARKLRDPAIMAALRRARDGAEIYRMLAAD
ncbi:MAG: PTS sugar transporter subunit IIA [Xanthobacteraceae bacterium]|jgi:PTS system nitrogen regulatory IIA component